MATSRARRPSCRLPLTLALGDEPWLAQLGLKKQGRALTEADKERIAFHESGHALVALSMAHSDPVHRVTIIPRSVGSLGATLQLPEIERYMMTRDELRDRICTLLGGRAAEEIACGDVSTGAENDFERATEIARQMVCRFGMSEKLGLVTYGRTGPARYAGFHDAVEDRRCSEATSRAIDAEIFAILSTEHTRARAVLRERRAALDGIARLLLAKETIERADLEAIVRAHARAAAAAPRT